MSRELRLALCCAAILAGLPQMGGAQEHLNCKSWLQLSSGDRRASVTGGTESAVAAIGEIVQPLPPDQQRRILDAHRACLSASEATQVKNLDALCSRDANAEHQAFIVVLSDTTAHCTRELAVLLE
jgi:hypothetical protein